MALKAKHQAFVNEYIKDRNGAESARRAGYSSIGAKKAASRLLKRKDVAAALQELQAKHQEQCLIETSYILENLKEVVERCLQRAPVMVREGRELVQATDADGNHIWQFDSAGANKALELLGKYKKLFTDKVEVEVIDQLAAKLKEARERAANAKRNS